MTDAEWTVLEPYFTATGRLRRPRVWSLSEIVDAVL
jgi:transposase